MSTTIEHTSGMTPARLAGLLADEANLRVLSAIALGAGNVEAIVEASGLDRQAVEGALRHLIGAGAVRDDGELTVDLAAFRVAARKRRPELPDATDEQASVLRNFVDDEGRLPALPARIGRRRHVLEYVATRFERGVEYPEAEVNARLRAVHDDYASLRRNLVDAGLLVRHAGIYRRP